MTILLIDGDPLLYRSFWNRDVAEATAHIDKQIRDLSEAVWAEEVRIAIKGPNNFRLDIADDYKAGRHQQRTEEEKKVLNALHAHLIEAHNAIPADGMEADDLLGIWATELGDECIIYSIDKDLRTVPGKHLDDTMTGEVVEISEHEAYFWELQQVLMGDPTDNIKGINKVGPVTSRKILNAGIIKGMEDAVIQAYKTAFGDEWQKHLTKTCRLIHMKRTPDDEWSL